MSRPDSGEFHAYSKVTRRVWNDRRFRSLSRAAPNAQTLWMRLLTGPELGPVPGLIRVGEAALAESLGWDMKGFREAFGEVFREGLAKADWEAGLVWLPKAMAHNEPTSPNVVVGWWRALGEMPECALLEEAMEALFLNLSAKGKAWEEAFGKASAKAFGKPYRKASPNPSPNPWGNQEQEQEQEQEQNSSPVSLSACVRAREAQASPEAVRTEYLTRWAKATDRKAPLIARGPGGSVWLELARELSGPDEIGKLLDAAFADDFVASTGWTPAAIRGSAQRLLATGPKRNTERGMVRAATAAEHAADADDELPLEEQLKRFQRRGGHA